MRPSIMLAYESDEWGSSLTLCATTHVLLSSTLHWSRKKDANAGE